MTYSKWLKTDLHIHSDMSKKTKNNDYDGENLTFDKLIMALKRENINLFSITDHNIINLSLYHELIQRRDELVRQNLNFVIGAEIDFLDDEVHDKIFHMLVYFNTYDLVAISKVLATIFCKENMEQIDTEVSPVSLRDFFKSVFDNGIKDIITIPHFNSKDKGIPPKDQIDKFTYTVFSALEDSNNRNNLIKSLHAFKQFNYVDVPVVVFSDNHNIEVYPSGKNGELNKQTSMYVLGNVEYPFSSIKSAFQDVSTRICIDGVNTRGRNIGHKYIRSLNIEGETLELSEYQNTIIGGFGTGKSFLLNMILNGKENVDQDKYKDLADKYNDFSIVFSDSTTRHSLNELSDEVKIIRFNQYKDIYFKDILHEEDKNTLEQNLHITFPSLNPIKRVTEDSIINDVNSLIRNCTGTSTITDVINYDAISRRNEKSYSFCVEELEPFYTQPQYFEFLIDSIQSESIRTVMERNLYSDDEKETLLNSKTLICTKNNEYITLSELVENILKKLGIKISEVNSEVTKRNTSISSNIQILEDIKTDISEYASLLKNLRSSSEQFEIQYSMDKYNELINLFTEKEVYSFKLIARYFADNTAPEYSTSIIKADYRKKSLFESIIRTVEAKDNFTQNQSFVQRINNFTSGYYRNFEKICYDIYDNNSSIMKKSAGEKANIIMNMIFSIIEDYSKQGVSCIVILDQPEDNLDNRGIQQEVVNRIRNMKNNNSLPQFICVSHNANISITADSENLILSNKVEGKCVYSASGIEDTQFINEVCRTVEGGIDALKKRGAKFNIPMIKELERGN